MPETTPLIKAALNLRVGAGFDVYDFRFNIAALPYLYRQNGIKIRTKLVLPLDFTGFL